MRFDLSLLAAWITPGARILDLGCGRGDLLETLRDTKGVTGYGVEQDETKAAAGISRGLSILQGDINTEIRDYPDQFFDYVVLSQTLQQVEHPLDLIREMLRVGRRGIVSFPNFAHWRNRLQLFFGGHAPLTRELPYEWYDTPNIRVITLKDFYRLCARYGFVIHDTVAVKTSDREHHGVVLHRLPNLRATYGIFLLGRG